MAGGRLERRVAKAKVLEECLKAEGRHMDAEVIRGLRASSSATQATLKTIHRDNMELRQRLGLPSFLDASRQETET